MSSSGKPALERLDVVRRHLLANREALGGGATATNPVILYDVLSDLENTPTWSPNVIKTRIALNYKKIPFRVEQVSFPDIRPLLEKMGHPPSSISRKGDKYYTLPAISDPLQQSGGDFIPVTDSYLIAEYLDKAYPSTPKLFPEGTEAFQSFVIKHLARPVMRALEQLLVPSVAHILDRNAEEYFRKSREVYYGKKIEEVCKGQEERKVQYAALQQALDDLNKHFEKVDDPSAGSLSTHIMGMKQGPCFVDIWVASVLYWTKVVPVGLDPEQGCVWDGIKRWNKGRWAKISEEFAQYTV